MARLDKVIDKVWQGFQQGLTRFPARFDKVTGKVSDNADRFIMLGLVPLAVQQCPTCRNVLHKSEMKRQCPPARLVHKHREELNSRTLTPCTVRLCTSYIFTPGELCGLGKENWTHDPWSDSYPLIQYTSITCFHLAALLKWRIELQT